MLVAELGGMIKLLPSRHIWRCPFSTSAPASGSTRTAAMVTPGRIGFRVKQALFSQYSLPGIEVIGILSKFGIGSSLSQWVSGGARTVEWQQGRLLAFNNVFALRQGARICSAKEGDGDSYSGNGGVKESFSETFRGRGRGGRAGSMRGRGGSGRGSFRPSFDRSEEGPKRFYSSDASQREEFRNSEGFRGRARGRGRLGNGGPRGRFSSSGRGSQDRESFLGRGNGGQREQFGGDVVSVRGRGRGRGRGSFGSGSFRREPFRSPDGEGDRESVRDRERFGDSTEGDMESFSSRSRGTGRGSFGSTRGGRGRFRDTQGARRSPSPYYRNYDSETDMSKRWDPTQRTRGERGSSRGGRGSRGSFSARGGRPSSNFGDRRLGQIDSTIGPLH